jgi:Protein of unknown function (DUF4054)
MTVTLSKFLVRYEEFTSVNPELVELILAEAEQDCLAEFWLEKRDRGVMLHAAHELTLRWYQTQRLQGAQGELETGKVPDLSKSMVGVPSVKLGDESYACTVYGLEILRLKQGLCILPSMNLSDF